MYNNLQFTILNMFENCNLSGVSLNPSDCQAKHDVYIQCRSSYKILYSCIYINALFHTHFNTINRCLE